MKELRNYGKKRKSLAADTRLARNRSTSLTQTLFADSKEAGLAVVK